jgi:hypothetical protein
MTNAKAGKVLGDSQPRIYEEVYMCMRQLTASTHRPSASLVVDSMHSKICITDKRVCRWHTLGGQKGAAITNDTH